MRRAKVFANGREAGVLEEIERGEQYVFRYRDGYNESPVSLTMPTDQREYTFRHFPPFFDGLLPEGVMLEALLRQRKIDRDDLFSQLLAVGGDMIGFVTLEEIP
jgi:serine/threonine-protein kinase HipA